jgi:hypothetical protein
MIDRFISFDCRRRLAVLCAIIAAGVYLAATAEPAAALELVTASEAALPAGSPPSIKTRGSPTRRPEIVVVWPSPDAGMLHSPFDMRIRFRAFGGAQIDPDSVVVTYLKQPAIDITQRIMPYISAAGIEVKQAQVPPGTHTFWIEVKDNDGRFTSTELSIKVAN